MEKVNKHLVLIRDLVEQIETHLSEEVSVLELAEKYALSPWHFQRLFKGLVGDSLGSYIRGRRLSKAAILLKKTDLSIVDIALEVGFQSHEAFSRSFKNLFEMTPKEVRQQNTSLNIKEKPQLTDALLHFLANRLDHKPQILVQPKKRIIGVSLEIDSPFVDPAHCTTIAAPWMKLLEWANKNNRIEGSVFYGITRSPSGNFIEPTLQYLAGLEVNQDENLPEGFEEVFLPEQRIALFEIATHVNDDNLKQKIDAIYGFWLSSSSYQRDTGDDYEMFKNMINIESAMTGNFESLYAIPITEKH